MAGRPRIRSSTIAMITAIAAIGIGVWDSAQTRKHNRLSVMPYLVVDYSLSQSRETATFSVEVNNEGVGPAIIESEEFTLPPGLGGGTYKRWNPAVDLLRSHGVNVPFYWELRPGEAVGVQKHVQLLRTMVDSGPQQAALLRELAEINVRITYKSIYGEPASAELQGHDD